jgi:hypothetical protein
MARLDQWEQAKLAFIAEMNNENARTKAICDGYMAEAGQWAASGIASGDTATDSNASGKQAVLDSPNSG